MFSCDTVLCLDENFDGVSLAYLFGYIFILWRMTLNHTSNAGVVLNVLAYIIMTKYLGIEKATWFIVSFGMTSFYTIIFIFLISLAFCYTFVFTNPTMRATFYYVMINIWFFFWAEMLVTLWKLSVPYPSLGLYVIYMSVGLMTYFFEWVNILF